MVTFKELSLPLKILVVLGWIIVGFNILLFSAGFVAGMINGFG